MHTRSLGFSIEVIRKVRRSLFHTILVQGGLFDRRRFQRRTSDQGRCGYVGTGFFPGQGVTWTFCWCPYFDLQHRWRPVCPSRDSRGDVWCRIWEMFFWLFLIPIAILIAMVMRKLQRLGKLTQKAEAQAGRYAGEAFRNWPVVHAFNQIDRECDRFGNAVDHFSLYSVASTRLKLAFDSMLFAVTFIGLVWFALFVFTGIAPETILADVKRGELMAFVFFHGKGYWCIPESDETQWPTLRILSAVIIG